MDFHIHGKYSGGTSKHLSVQSLYEGAKKKGLHVISVGDVTHPLWVKEVKRFLEFDEEKSLYKFKELYFLLSTEVSNIFERDGKTVKVHSLILAKTWEEFSSISDLLSKYGDLTADGRPTLFYDISDMRRELRDLSKDIYIIPAHIWTPWFSLFGSKFGLDSITEAFEGKFDGILALETGLSSDPVMNRVVSELDRFPLVSNSDAHSPGKLGREANSLEVEKISYEEIIDAVKNKRNETYEFFPEEGKYYADGHRRCGVWFYPEEAEVRGNICPVCGKPLTLGVLHRVRSLSDRSRPQLQEKYKYIIPLKTILSKVLGRGEGTKAIEEEYDRLVRFFGGELAFFDASLEQIKEFSSPRLYEVMESLRKGNIYWRPGYDGVFGEFYLSKEKLNKEKTKRDEKISTRNLLEFM